MNTIAITNSMCMQYCENLTYPWRLKMQYACSEMVVLTSYSIFVTLLTEKVDCDLDRINREILNILQQNSSISVKDIAVKIGLSTTPTYERIKWMEQEGIIEKYVVLANREKIGYNLMVYCNVVLKEQSKDALVAFETAVCKMPEVLEIMSISGNYDYMLKTIAKDIQSYNDFIVNVLSNTPNISHYHSNIVLEEVKRETAMFL